MIFLINKLEIGNKENSLKNKTLFEPENDVIFSYFFQSFKGVIV